MYSHASALSGDRVRDLDMTHVALCDPGRVWEIDLINHGLHELIGGGRFIVGGDLNSSTKLDRGGRGANTVLFANMASVGFVDATPRLEPDLEPQTFFGANSRPMQLDYLFTDSHTQPATGGWRVYNETRDQAAHLSDHAPIAITVP